MAENKQNESCITRIENWFITFYREPCFWLKAIPLAILIGLAAIGLYQIVTSAFHYFSEPLSYFDPERLGQLGDFLGGTLNPIFGLATVCLLLWSVFIQRKELQETRKELKASSTALNGQLTLAKNEYNRKQLEERLSILEKQYDEAFTSKFDDVYITEREIEPNNKSEKFYNFLTLHYVIQKDLDEPILDEIKSTIKKFKAANIENNLEKLIAESSTYHISCWKMYISIKKFKSLTIELISITISRSIVIFLIEELMHKLKQCQKIGIISENEVSITKDKVNEYLKEISK